jgi:hypothetical protein
MFDLGFLISDFGLAPRRHALFRHLFSPLPEGEGPDFGELSRAGVRAAHRRPKQKSKRSRLRRALRDEQRQGAGKDGDLDRGPAGRIAVALDGNRRFAVDPHPAETPGAHVGQPFVLPS